MRIKELLKDRYTAAMFTQHVGPSRWSGMYFSWYLCVQKKNRIRTDLNMYICDFLWFDSDSYLCLLTTKEGLNVKQYACIVTDVDKTECIANRMKIIKEIVRMVAKPKYELEVVQSNTICFSEDKQPIAFIPINHKIVCIYPV